MKALLFLVAAASCVQAQDVRGVTSPDGRLEFRIFVGQPPESGLPRLAYQVFYRGKRIVDTSYLGIDIYPQEPLLGQYVGLIGSSLEEKPGYHELRVKYMQNGSLGRLVNVEVRVSDREVRFRYFVPKSTPLMEPFQVDDEKTEFAVEDSARGAVHISEENDGNYPAMSLVPLEGSVVVTHLAQSFEARTPLTTPWRVITLK